MNAENFAGYLEDPSKLYQIPYQELKDLVEQYPYCQPLRILLLQKSQMESHPEFDRNLHAAAAYLPDRTLLYLLIREFQSLEKTDQLFELEEERLELKALSEILVEREPLAPELPAQTAPSPTDISSILDLFLEEPDEEEEIIRPVPQEKIPPPTPEAPPPSPPVRSAPPAPKPKTAFTSWDKRYERLRHIVSEKALEIPPPPAVKDKSAAPERLLAQDLAKRSVEEKKAIASETLANLLARQGHTQRAIAMFEKLCLIIPEKSTYFAQQIEKLKRK